MQKPQKQGVKPMNDYIMRGIAVVGIAIAAYGLYTYAPYIPKMVRSIEEQQKRLARLDSAAIHPRDDPFPGNRIYRHGSERFIPIIYEDTDGDGDYDSIARRRNSDNEFVSMPIAKGSDGGVRFLNLSDTAVDPLHIPKNLWGLTVDYLDLDGNGKLESVTYFSLDNKETQRMKMELIGGKYTLSPLSD